MRSIGGLVSVAVAAAIWIVLAAQAGFVTRDFFTNVDRAIYVSVDDGNANIVYDLATHGRYAFPASPILVRMSRMHGLFNYGPWYFWAAAALAWAFGFSLTLVRSMHLWVVLASVIAAVWWFRGPARAAVAGLFGFGILSFFAVAEWPMARPDSFVTLFAVVLIMAGGIGISRGSRIAWFVGGVAAASGAFTHLVAGSLLVSPVVMLGVFAWTEWRQRRPLGSRTTGAAIALAAGLVAGTLVFYASFGFDVRSQWLHLSDYVDVNLAADSYFTAIARHFQMAFGFLPTAIQRSVGVTMAIAWLMIAVALASNEEPRAVLTYVLPPATVWTLYWLSIGKYARYHEGYAILHHAMFMWTAAAIVFVLCGGVRARRGILTTAFALATLVFGVRQLRAQERTPPRAAQAQHRVAFAEYVDHVLESVPRGSIIWGSVFFGLESPGRVQLVQQDDAVTMWSRLPREGRAEVVPDFLIWGYPEQRDDALSGLDGAATRLASTQALLSAARYRLVSLVDAPVYGPTRIYARVNGPAPPSGPPSASAYDGIHQSWLDHVGPPLSVAFTPAAAVLRIGYQAAPPRRTPAETVAADLPPGHYLIHVTMPPGASRRMIAVTSWTMLEQTILDLGPRPEGDFVEDLGGTGDVFALIDHPGGALYVSRFGGDSGQAIASVSASPLEDLSTRPRSHARPLPPLTRWVEMPGVQGEIRGARLRIDGDASSGGYQAYSQLVTAEPGQRIEADVPSTVVQGRLCAGVLNARGQWIENASKWREQFDFTADATGGFRIVYANCQRAGEAVVSQFEVGNGWYRAVPQPTYAETLTQAAFQGGALAGPPPLPRFPEQPLVMIKPADVVVRSNAVASDGRTWTIAGRADAASAYLLRTQPRFIDSETRLLVAGRLDRGPLVVGLLKDDEWVVRRSVTSPGEFVALLAPRTSGRYAVAVASGAPDGDLAATLTRVDLLPPVRPAK